MGERNRKKIDILYFVNRLLQRLLSPSILHTVLSSLQYPYTEHPKIINFRYPTDPTDPVGYSSCLDYKTRPLLLGTTLLRQEVRAIGRNDTE